MKRQGFTLVELAIVLVIIGIIMGAILKGKDLIENARIKKLGTAVMRWEAAQWTFLDRYGRFAGDSNLSGIIYDDSSENVKNDFDNAKWAGGEPSQRINIGDKTFYLFFGNDGSKKNIIVVCVDDKCNTKFSTANVLPYIKGLDTMIDGHYDGADGNVRCVDKPDDVNNSGKWEVKYNSSPTSVSCDNAKALVYYFDTN